MGYCILRLEKVKISKINTLTGIYRHNHRIYNVANAIPEKIKENENLVSLNGKTLLQAVNKRLDEGLKEKKIRSNAVIGFDVFMSFSRENREDLNVDVWAKDSIKWLKDKYGDENVVDAVLHKDEWGCEHIHAFVVPITKEGKLSAYSFLKDKKDYSEMQTSYYDAVKKHGLKRGLRGSVAEHTAIKRFYSELNQVIEKTLPKPLDGEDIEVYYNRVNPIHQDLAMEFFKNSLKLERVEVESNTGLESTKMSLDLLKKEYERKMKALKKFYEKITLESIENGKSLEEMKKSLYEIQALQGLIKSHPDEELRKNAKNTLKQAVNWFEEKNKDTERFFK